MDILAVPVPLFNDESIVEAYMFRYRRGNDILQAASDSIHFDGAMRSPILQTIATVGIEALTMGKVIFVPINKYMLMAKLDEECKESPESIVFLADSDVGCSESILEHIKRLKSIGFSFAVQGVENCEDSMELIELCDYIFHDQRKFGEPNQVKLREALSEKLSGIKNVYTNIDEMEVYLSARKKYKGLYEGRFYRMPLSEGAAKVSPMQVNMINLLNKVRSENFDFDDVAKIIQRDPALTISLLRMVNTGGRRDKVEIKSISGAVVMMGQKDLRKWISAAAANQLGAEKPGEIVKLSLIRARFAEALAVLFGLYADAQSLFLMGIFSVLDAMLEMPMKDALKMVLVSSDIAEALTDRTGKFGDVYKFIIDYESAEWNSVSRTMIIHDLKTKDVYDAYISALCWYRDMLLVDVEDLETEVKDE